MRILAHLSQVRLSIATNYAHFYLYCHFNYEKDAALLKVMNTDLDIFNAIAARWHKLAENAVSAELRDGTKQICYGIVYGMGVRSLADALKCKEQEATSLSQQFHLTYPGIRLILVINFCLSNTL